MSRPDVPAQPALNALLLPLLGRTLLLPSVALAELVNLLPVEPGGAAAPAWYLGAVRWRERRVPLLSFEAAATGGAPPALRRIAVLHALGGHGGLDFLALALQGLPRPCKVESDLAASGEACAALELEAVTLAGESARIPDLPALERLLLDTGLWTEAAPPAFPADHQSLPRRGVGQAVDC